MVFHDIKMPSIQTFLEEHSAQMEKGGSYKVQKQICTCVKYHVPTYLQQLQSDMLTAQMLNNSLPAIICLAKS